MRVSMGMLFDHEPPPPTREPLEEGALLLRGFAAPGAAALVEEIARIAEAAPFRHLETPGGYTMSVAMTNCGRVGWVSDRTGYRYDPIDPASGAPWPAMPAAFLSLAALAAAEAGFADYRPDACLINRYAAGAKLGLHQDRDEQDAWAPIVSVSLGLPAVFLWGGQRRADPVRRLRVESGDVAVWGGPARFVYHGVAPLKAGDHVLTGAVRLNLTFRKVYRSQRGIASAHSAQCSTR
ncbi:MAG TPA: DNA oxidative demethylase AlkB [Candidatus Sulfopaludibacter sp.]|nr:DNA oxidative demethylase AlkB [Candidatus Sulfopaludibacter sp.]